MTAFILRRLIQAAMVVACVSVVVFVGLYGIGDPALLLIDPDAPAAERERATQMLGLDRPLWAQYLTFVTNALQGDLGRSYVFNEPSIGLILSRLPATLELALVALVLAVFVGIPLGLWAGLKGDGVADRAIVTGSILGFSLPNFWQGMILVWVFAVILGWLPSNGRGELATIPVLGIKTSLATVDGLRHLLLPAVEGGEQVAAHEVERSIERLVAESMRALDRADITDEARHALAELGNFVAWRDR